MSQHAMIQHGVQRPRVNTKIRACAPCKIVGSSTVHGRVKPWGVIAFCSTTLI